MSQMWLLYSPSGIGPTRAISSFHEFEDVLPSVREFARVNSFTWPPHWPVLIISLMTAIEMTVLHCGTHDSDIIESDISVGEPMVCLPCTTPLATSVVAGDLLSTALVSLPSKIEPLVGEFRRDIL